MKSLKFSSVVSELREVELQLPYFGKDGNRFYHIENTKRLTKVVIIGDDYSVISVGDPALFQSDISNITTCDPAEFYTMYDAAMALIKGVPVEKDINPEIETMIEDRLFNTDNNAA